MRLTKTPIVLVVALALTGCQSTGPKAGIGGLAGAVAGGLLGSQIGKGSGRVAAAAVGAVVGGIIGHEIGRSLDAADRRMAAEAEYRALEYGATGSETAWRNPDSGHRGTIQPGKPYVRNRVNCRDYTHTIYVDGRPETMRGTACRQPDGTWSSRG